MFNNLKKIKDQIAALAGERQQLARDLETKKQRREWLQTAPLPHDEHVEKLCNLVDKHAAEFSEQLRRRTRGLENKPFHEFGELQLFAVSGQSGNGAEVQRALCGLFPEQVKAGLRASAERWTWHSSDSIGPGQTSRRTEIENLDKEIAELEHKLAELDNAAATAGVRVDGGAVSVRGDGTKIGSGRRSGSDSLERGGRPLK